MSISRLGAFVLPSSITAAAAAPAASTSTSQAPQAPVAKAPLRADSITLSSGKTYTVLPGDTLGSIAEKADVSLQDLKKLNPDLFQNGTDSQGRLRKADGWLIYPGDVVKLAAGASAPAPTPPATPTPATGSTSGISQDAIALNKAKQTIDGAAIASPPSDATKLPAWLSQSTQTLKDAHGALDTLKTAAENKKFSIVDFTHYQQKVDGLDTTFKQDLAKATSPTAPTGPQTPVAPPAQAAAGPDQKAIDHAKAFMEGAAIAPLPKDETQTADWYDQSRATLRTVHGAIATLYDANTAGTVDDRTFQQYLVKGEHLVKYFDQQCDLIGGPVHGGGASSQWGGADPAH